MNSPDPNSGTNATSRRLTAHASRRLYQTGIAIWLAAGAWLGWTSPHSDILLTALGLLIFSLGVWPALLWAKQVRPWFPVFEIFMLTTVPFYTLPFFSSQSSLVDFSQATLWRASWTIALFQAGAFAAFLRLRGQPSRNPWLVKSIFPDNLLRLAQAGLWLNTIYLFVENYTDLIPWELRGPIRAMFFGLGIISIFILSRLWGQRALPAWERSVLVLNVVLQVVIQLTGLYLINAIILIGLAGIGYASVSRRIPIVLIAIALPVLGVLHNGKAAMRRIYWSKESHVRPELTDLPSFFRQWVTLGMKAHGVDEDKDDKGLEITSRLLQRASLFQMVALTVANIPERLDYLDGESYIDVPALLIPRFLWPNKPSGLVSNVRLALYLGLVNQRSAQSVSIAFGVIAEAYANFGLLGAVGLGLIAGAGFKKASTLAVGAAPLSALGLFTILLAAWSLQVEQVASTWITSLFQASMVVIAVPLVVRRMFSPM